MLWCEIFYFLSFPFLSFPLCTFFWIFVDFKAYIDKTKKAISEKTEAAQKERENKAKADEEAKAKAEAEKAERLPDLEKISLYTDELLKVQIPQLKNETAGEILAEFKNSLKREIDKTIAKIKILK